MAKRRSDALRTYRSKRDFSRTAEPRGEAVGARRGNSFVIQKHAARRTHFDFRLELDGVLKSWAVTRGPSLDPAQKRLAVRTEDHPLEYGEFEGTIPKGEYGGGIVMLWERGTWTPRGDPHTSLAEGNLKLDLDGERLKGGFALVRLKARGKETRENWLLIKERDEYADRRPGADPMERWTTSVVTGRTFEEIASDYSSVWSSKQGAQVFPASAPPGRRARPATRAKAARPKFVPPQLATSVDQAPEGEEWLHEIKYDGYRVIAALGTGGAVVYTRTGQDWTHRFSPIADALAAAPVSSALLDGEIVVMDEQGQADFGRLQRALKGNRDSLTLLLFDLLHLDGEDLRKLPLIERKARLKRLLGDMPAAIRYSDHVVGHGAEVYERASRMGLEGIVSKRADRPYQSGRTTTWLKMKCLGRDEFVIGGYRTSNAKGRPFSSLLVGEFEDGRLIYRGRVGTGFDERTLGNIAQRLRSLARDKSPFVAVPAEVRSDARWVEPALVAEIAYTSRTTDGILRHPSFIGLREDKKAQDVVAVTDTGSIVSKQRQRATGDTVVRGVKLTHPDKILFPAIAGSKQDLADYLALVADRMLPHVKGRPLSLVRCPEGVSAECFFQKHRKRGLPKPLKSILVEDSDGQRADYIMIDSVEGIVAAAQVGGIELHLWGSRGDNIERPDRLVLDLDPDPSVAFTDVRRAAREFRDLLQAAGLVSFPLLTGGKGIHVVAPLRRQHDWNEVKAFARGIAHRVADLDPARFVATMSKAKRKGRIFVDWMRNERGSTAIAPYSARAKPSASVAMPVSWDELEHIERADLFTLSNVRRRLADNRDPWTGYAAAARALSKKLLSEIAVED
jgi:bifunctional non-homologous end joining protein LigD